MTMEEFSEILVRLCRERSFGFTVSGQNISLDLACSATGYLPVLARRADSLARLCFGQDNGLKLSYDEAEHAEMGIKVVFKPEGCFTVRLLCLLDIIRELARKAPSPETIALDDLLYD